MTLDEARLASKNGSARCPRRSKSGRLTGAFYVCAPTGELWKVWKDGGGVFIFPDLPDGREALASKDWQPVVANHFGVVKEA